MREIRTEIEIEADAERVWEILTDFEAYPAWNPFIPRASGEVREGEELEVRIEPPGGKGMTFKPTVTRVLDEREFRWLGRLVVPGVFDGEHIFEVAPAGEARTRFVHRERFKGLLVPLLWNNLDTKARRGFEAMNEALKRRAENGGA